MDWKLELVIVPVSDVDRSKAFYADQVGFNVDYDASPTPDIRFVQERGQPRPARPDEIRAIPIVEEIA